MVVLQLHHIDNRDIMIHDPNHKSSLPRYANAQFVHPGGFRIYEGGVETCGLKRRERWWDSWDG